jgi:hypothetical protein
MTKPTLISAGSGGVLNVGISVSDSADLDRLGLTSQHCNFAIAELSRAILLAGGAIVSGGRIKPEGFVQVIMDEVRRYGGEGNALTICLAESVHRKMTDEDIADVVARLDISATLVCLDLDGREVDHRHRPPAPEVIDGPTALTAMRRAITARSDARVLVGGQLSNYEGTMPGIIEEALLSLKSGKPLYIAGGFGGAAAAVARALDRDVPGWAPPGFPAGIDRAAGPLRELVEAAQADGAIAPDGLSEHERQQLAMTHRPGDVATLVVTGLTRLAGRT